VVERTKGRRGGCRDKAADAQTSTFHSQLQREDERAPAIHQRTAHRMSHKRAQDAPLAEVAHQRVVEDRLEPALDVNRLVHDLLAQGWDRVLVDRLLEQLRQLLDRPLQVGLVVLEDARLVVRLEAAEKRKRARSVTGATGSRRSGRRRDVLEGHRVCPFERAPGDGEHLDRLLGKLDLDPRQVRDELHLLHLLLGLGVELAVELGRELVVCPPVIVLRRRGESRSALD
jgi:hypothetical protein